MAEKNEDLDLVKHTNTKNNRNLGKRILLLVAALAIGGGGFAAAVLFMGSDATPKVAAEKLPVTAVGANEAHEEEQLPEALYQPLDPPFVINANNPGSRRLMQIRMQAMSYDQGVINQLQKNMALVRDAVILLLSAQDFDQLGSPEEKEQLRGKIKKAIESSVRFPKGAKLETVLFTEFIME